MNFQIHPFALSALLGIGICLQADPTPLTKAINPLLGIPYTSDGTQNASGQYCTFTQPRLQLKNPGLNCSGFVYTAFRNLAKHDISLEDATLDRLNDSSPSAFHGRDWDFGWDLILNLSEGFARHWMLPEGRRDVSDGEAKSVQGFPTQNREAWAKVRPHILSEHLYLATFTRWSKSRLVSTTGKAIFQHHHVALLLKDEKGQVWIYQTLPKGRSHRLNLSSRWGMDRLSTMFGKSSRILILEVELRR